MGREKGEVRDNDEDGVTVEIIRDENAEKAMAEVREDEMESSDDESNASEDKPKTQEDESNAHEDESEMHEDESGRSRR